MFLIKNYSQKMHFQKKNRLLTPARTGQNRFFINYFFLEDLLKNSIMPSSSKPHVTLYNFQETLFCS